MATLSVALVAATLPSWSRLRRRPPPGRPRGSSRSGPRRLVDTRLAGQTAVEGTVADNTAVPIRVAGMGGIPTGISAVVVNLTVVNTTGAGYVQAFPTGQAAIGSSSNLNVVAAGQILSSLAVVPCRGRGADQRLPAERADLVIDVFGYFTPATSSKAGRYVSAATPARLVDSRDGTGFAGPGKIAGGDTRVVQVTGRGGVPASGVTASGREPHVDRDRRGRVPDGLARRGGPPCRTSTSTTAGRRAPTSRSCPSTPTVASGCSRCRRRTSSSTWRGGSPTGPLRPPARACSCRSRRVVRSTRAPVPNRPPAAGGG